MFVVVKSDIDRKEIPIAVVRRRRKVKCKAPTQKINMHHK